MSEAKRNCKRVTDCGKEAWSETVRIATVVFCVFAVVVLAFAGKLTKGAVAVLSGIAGFVLGGVSKDGASLSGPENGNS